MRSSAAGESPEDERRDAGLVEWGKQVSSELRGHRTGDGHLGQRWLAGDGPVMPLSGCRRHRWRKIRDARQRTIAVTWLDDAETVDLGTFQAAVELAERCADSGAKVEHALGTTGARLDDAWCRFLAERDVLVGPVPEGTIDTNGRETGCAVGRRPAGTARLLRRHGVDCNLLYPVHGSNADHSMQVYRYCWDEVGVRHVQFIPVLERVGEVRGAGRSRAGRAAVSKQTVRPEQWGAFLAAVFDEWVRRDVGQQFVHPFEQALTAWTAAAWSPHAARPRGERLPLYCRCCPVLPGAVRLGGMPSRQPLRRVTGW
ncbi:hypothetical protein [Actinomadura sp. NPDC049753]|uniref:hypothetical protein n=1 Tax=Actinomadura sp. NPDC049753 TaxID=3154739 RepID=UPI0034428897